MPSLRHLLATLSEDINVRGHQWERLCKWFLQNDPRYKGQLEKVWLWDEWPGRWGPDAGIDLVAKHRDGSLWAIQSKAYAETTTVSMRDISQFLTESARPQFSYRLLIATTNRLSRNGEQALNAQEKPAGRLLLADLERSAVGWPSSPGRLQSRRPKPHKPRPHQRKAIKDVIAGFDEHDRGQMIMACGTGKTLTSLWIAETLEAKRTLVLVPSLSLLSQTLREWLANASGEMAVLPVCSDETVRGADQLVSHTGELGLPVTTDSDDIARFLRGRGRRVVMATYQSSPRIAESHARGRVPRFDLIIADEAHRTTGPASSDFATILDQDQIRAKRRLFMTATPRYFTGRVKKAAGENDMEIASMDDEAVYGPVSHSLTFGDAIKRNLLSDYQVVIVGVDDATIAQHIEDGVLVSTGNHLTTDARTLAAHIGLAKAMRDYDLKRTISFHSRIKNAQSFSSRFPQIVEWMPTRQAPKGDLWAEYVSGEMPAGQRSIRLGHLRDLEGVDRGMLSNARCLAEGVDVPTLDGVAFIDPKSSQVDIVQAVGRAIRKAPDKTVGTIVLPVFIDGSQDADQVLSSSAFKPVWWVLNALRDHDANLAEALDGIRRAIGKIAGSTVKLPTKVVMDLPTGIDAQFSDALSTRLVEQTTASWEFWYGLLERFVARFGHSQPSSHDEFEGERLGTWVSQQRSLRNGGQLDPHREAELEKVPEWTWSPHDDTWMASYERVGSLWPRYIEGRLEDENPEQLEFVRSWSGRQRSHKKRRRIPSSRVQLIEDLQGWSWETDPFEEAFALLGQFVDREGHASPPTGHTEDGFKLGAWVTRVRMQKREGRLVVDSQLFESLPGWTWDPLDENWVEYFKAVQRFHQRQGHPFPSDRHIEDDLGIGQWLANQRRAYKANRLPTHRIETLETLIGWDWDRRQGRNRFKWLARLETLQTFVQREGHAAPPQSYVESGIRLGSWVAVQRKAHTDGLLEPWQIEVLESMDGWTWDARGARWHNGYQHLRRFVEREGHSRIPVKQMELGFRLGGWVHSQRQYYRKGSLSPDRIARLEALPGWVWTPFDAKWEHGYELASAYADEHGDADVPSKHRRGGFALGAWVSRQRSLHRQDRLSDVRRLRLEGLKGWVWEVSTGPRRSWERSLDVLKAFAAREGHARPLFDHRESGIALGNWVLRQRRLYREGTLSEDRQQALEAIACWTWAT